MLVFHPQYLRCTKDPLVTVDLFTANMERPVLGSDCVHLILLVTFFPLVYPEFDICRQILFLESRLEFHLNDGIGWSTAVFPLSSYSAFPASLFYGLQV